MKYEIKNAHVPTVICYLKAGEKMICEKETLARVDDCMKITSHAGSLLQHIFSNKLLSDRTYTASNDGLIAFSTVFPGNILPIDVAAGREIIIPRSAFVASEAGVRTSLFFNRKLYTCLFKVDSNIFIKLSGQGKCFIKTNSKTVEYQLLPGQQIIIDSDCLTMMDATCQMQSQSAFRFSSSHIFPRTVITGPGRVVIQTALPFLTGGE